MLDSIVQKFWALQLQKQTTSPEFDSRVQRGLDTSRLHINFDIDLALAVIPVDDIHTKTRELQNTQNIPFTHALTKALLNWYKHKFFKWVNQLDCQACGNKTENVGVDKPNFEELSYLTSRTELHQCTKCNQITRFPRIKSFVD